ncbi:MAG TPA: DUF1573 domain-containing protein [Thermoanaerobaculia bacterium]|nr:DUF1573 domain-containing protein [Thermoanaerobaculia bacterium]
MKQTLIAIAWMQLAAVLPVAAAAPSPKVVVPEATRDLGALAKGESVDVVFALRNEGLASLEITSVTPSCGCTVAEFDPIIPAGGSGEIRTTFDTRTLDGKTGARLTVLTNDPQQPKLRLTILAEVIRYLDATPGSARWIYTQGEAEGSLGQTIFSVDGQPFEVLRVDTPGPQFRIEVRPAAEGERVEKASGVQWRVIPTLARDAPVGALSGAVVVHTDHPRQPVVEIPVSGFVRPAMYIEPASGEFGTLSLSEPRKSIYNLRSFGSQPLQIEKVETGVPGLGATVETTEAGWKWRIVLEFDPERIAPGPFQGKLVVHTDSEVVPRFELPLSGNLVKGTEAADASAGG